MENNSLSPYKQISFMTILMANYLNFMSFTKKIYFNGVALCCFFSGLSFAFCQSFYDFCIYLFSFFFLTKAQTLFAKYLITMELSNPGVVLNKNLALTIFLTITGNS